MNALQEVKLGEYQETFQLDLNEVQVLQDLWQEDAELYNDANGDLCLPVHNCPACGNRFDDTEGCKTCGFGISLSNGGFWLPARSNVNWAEAFAEY